MDHTYQFCFFCIRSRLLELVRATPTTLDELHILVIELSEFQERLEELLSLANSS